MWFLQLLEFQGWRTHWQNYISISFHIEWDMNVVTVFLSILNQMEFHLVQNWKENYHDHIPFNMKGNGNIVLSVQDRKCCGIVFLMLKKMPIRFNHVYVLSVWAIYSYLFCEMRSPGYRLYYYKLYFFIPEYASYSNKKDRWLLYLWCDCYRKIS